MENIAFSYWYPQFAVFDDIHGWDTLQYRLHEFFQTLRTLSGNLIPDSMMVWATGLFKYRRRIDPDLCLPPVCHAHPTRVNIGTRADHERGTATRPGTSNTWKFSAEGVPDFAFATADYYYWTLRVPSWPNRTQEAVDAVYQPSARDFYSVAEYAREILEFMSNDMPGIPYPYPAMTVFNGDLVVSVAGWNFP